nr:helitron helicase-like domain-containing protein [Tanacetum cinerariifolium]
MSPPEGAAPRFLQLYIYDTANEVKNRMAHFRGQHEGGLKKEIIEGLIEFLDNHNALIKIFQTARDKYMESDIPEFKVNLYNVIGTRQYELPTPDTIGAIVFGGSTTAENEFNLIIKEHLWFPQRVNKLHPCYMSLQFPLLFIYDEEGYHKGMRLVDVPGKTTGAKKKMPMNIDLGTRLVLSASFTGGPRYMYSHYLDALAIYRVHRNPSFFNSFTCNTNWPEIQDYMESFPELTPADRADIVDHVFKKKNRHYIKFVRGG